MKFIPFYPLFKLIRIIVINKGVAVRNIFHLAPWLVKTILLEPLRWIELICFERRITRHGINAAPVFILGHYRSGTTYLQRLLMQDERLGYMSIFQSAVPEIMLAFEKILTPPAEWLTRLFRVNNPFHRIRFTWQFPGEDDVGMTALLSEYGAQWGMLFPGRMQVYSQKFISFESATEKEKQQWKKDYLYLVKKLSVKNKGRRLVLKSPPNTARIPELLELFPDARFIFIHRNPFEVYSSTKRLWKITLENYALGGYDRKSIRENILENYDTLMHRYLGQRSLLPAGRLIEIPYENLINSPLATMEKVYSQLDLGDFHQCRDAMQAFLQQQTHKPLSHMLAPREQKTVEKRWQRYTEEWNYTDPIIFL